MAANPVDQTFAIAKLAVEVTASPGQTKVYGAPDPLTFTFTVSAGSLASGDAFSGAPGRVLGENAGTYAITQGSLVLNSNYDLSFVGRDFTITPKAASVTPSAASKVYGTSDPALTGTLSGFLAADGVTAAFSRTAGQTVSGSPYTISAVLSPVGVLSNYGITYNSASFTITRAILSVAAADKSRTFGAVNPALTATITGFVNGDPSSVVSGSPALSTTAVTGSAVGTYPITAGLGTLTAANYSFTFVPGTLSITKAPLTISANPSTKVYGTTNPPFSVSYSGFANGDGAASLGGTLFCTSTATASSPVGSYPITCSGLTSSNYTLTWVPGALAVTKAPLTVTANDLTRILGATTPAFSVRYAGFVNGQTPSVLGGSLAFATTPSTVSATVPGLYAVRPSGVTSANYAITFVNGTLTTTYKIGLLYDPAKPMSRTSVPITVYLTNAAGKNLSTSSTTLTALEVDRGSATVVKFSGAGSLFTFNTKLTSGGGYQFNGPTGSLTSKQGVTYTLLFRVSTDPPGIVQSVLFILK